MRTRKSPMLILATLILFVLLAGCGADNTDINTPAPNTNTPTPNSTTGTTAPNTETDSSSDSDDEIGDNQEYNEEAPNNFMNLKIGERLFTATLVDNSTTEALRDLLSEGPITIDMDDYGNMEKVGSLGTDLPRNDEPITTEPGDLILYQGNAFVIYYAPNSWDFTRIGKMNDVTQEELKQALGSGAVTVTLSLARD